MYKGKNNFVHSSPTSLKTAVELFPGVIDTWPIDYLNIQLALLHFLLFANNGIKNIYGSYSVSIFGH